MCGLGPVAQRDHRPADIVAIPLRERAEWHVPDPVQNLGFGREPGVLIAKLPFPAPVIELVHANRQKSPALGLGAAAHFDDLVVKHHDPRGWLTSGSG